MVIAWRSVVDGCVLICLLCRVFFKVRANRRVGKSKDPKNRVPEIAVPDLEVADSSFRDPVYGSLNFTLIFTHVLNKCYTSTNYL